MAKKVDTGHREARGLPRTPCVFPTSDPRYFLRSLGPEHVQGRPAPPWQPATSLNPKDAEVLPPTCPLWLTSKASANFLMGQVPYSLHQGQIGPGVINKLPTPPGSGKLKRWHTIERCNCPYKQGLCLQDLDPSCRTGLWKFLFLFYVSGCFECHMQAMPDEATRGQWIPLELELQCEPPCRCWELVESGTLNH